MSEQEQTSQLSALFDGELPAGQAEMVIRRAVRDPSLRATWERYALIGACMRDEPFRVMADGLGVADKVRARLAGEPELVAPGSHRTAGSVLPAAVRKHSWLLGRGAVGGAIAASVALVSILIVRSVGLEGAGSELTARADAAGGSAALVADGTDIFAGNADANSAMPSYTTPVDSAAGAQRVPGSLFKYVVAHSEVASSAYRLSPMSAEMGGYDASPGASESAADEAGARR